VLRLNASGAGFDLAHRFVIELVGALIAWLPYSPYKIGRSATRWQDIQSCCTIRFFRSSGN